MSQNREPRGIPTGGRYAAQTHGEALLTLTDEIGRAASQADDAKSKVAALRVQAAVVQTLAMHPEAAYIMAGYSDQDYYGTLLPHAPLDADGEEIDDTADLAWCNRVEEHLGQLDDSDRPTYERWASDEYLALPPRERNEQPVIIDISKVLADPAVSTPARSELADGTEVWELSDGCRHRLGGPAVVRPDGYEEWDRYGLHHRDGGPAVTWPDGARMWYQNGKLHREDGPAVVKVVDGEDPVYEWYYDGRGQPLKATANETELYLQSKPPRAELVDVADQYRAMLAEHRDRPGVEDVVGSLRNLDHADHEVIAERISIAAGMAAGLIGRRYPIRLWR